jgi:poly-gamma-glutamate synthesis protein (capsule biosynthesis protein)
MSTAPAMRSHQVSTKEVVRICLAGDVMTGRGIDQVLPHPCDAELREDYVRSATEYVRLAETANGPIPKPVAFSYIWGAALDETHWQRADVRIVNLETSITRSNHFAAKGINYRMSPENAGCLKAAAIDCCTLANNHVLDFGPDGLLDTLAALDRLRIKVAGAGRSAVEAGAPAIMDIGGWARVLVWSFASTSSGVPRSWAATGYRAGVNLLPDISDETTASIADQIARLRRPCDVIVISLHWEPNWGYDVPEQHRRFAHALIDQAGVSIVHGHSSHHAKAIDAYRNRIVLYGCGDFLNDYEGIEGYETYRDDLALLYVADINVTTKHVVALDLVPFQIRRFQLIHPSAQDRSWLQQTLDRESRGYRSLIELSDDGRLRVRPGSTSDSETGPTISKPRGAA